MPIVIHRITIPITIIIPREVAASIFEFSRLLAVVPTQRRRRASSGTSPFTPRCLPAAEGGRGHGALHEADLDGDDQVPVADLQGPRRAKAVQEAVRARCGRPPQGEV